MRKRAPAWPAALDRRIEVHDRQQLELKLEYQPAPDERHSRYAAEVFICVPGSLNVSPDTAPRDELYADIHNYVRLKTPELAFPELEALPTSPLVRIGQELGAVAAGGDPGRLVYECKLFACVFRGALREVVERCEAALPDVPAVAALVSEGIDGATLALAAYRSHRARAEADAIPERARAAYRLADEFASISVEQQLRRVIVQLDRRRIGAEIKAQLLDAILVEERYRRERGWTSILDPESDNENYVHRAGVLKKYCSSALFLQIRRYAARRPWQEVFFAIAAGIAMAFATIVAFWAQARYPELGLRLFLILIVAYMFKDRLKEGTRALFARFLERSMWDRRIVIEDPAGGDLGTCREKIEFAAPAALPAEVRAIRQKAADPGLRAAEDELHETVIHYRKSIVLDAAALEARRGGGGAITDILRFHVGRLLRDTDEPEQEIEYMDRETQEMSPIRAAKVYHVDVVFQFTGRPDEPVSTTLMRLILDRHGIKRIERMEPAAAKAASGQAASSV